MAKIGKTKKSAEEERRDLVQASLWGQLQRFSHDLIFMALMRSGGEPFGAPFEAGVPTLTERVVRLFRQRSFFAFNTLEKLNRRSERNKYTRHGAAPYRGAYMHLPTAQAGRGFVARLLRYLRDNRYFLFTAVQPSANKGASRPSPDDP